MSVGTTSPESARKSTAKYAQTENGKKHIQAKRAIEREKRAGRLKAPEKCPKCGRKVRLDFHHTKGYSEGQRLTGVWRCRLCHSADDTQRHGKAMSKARAKAEQTKKQS